MPQTSTATTGAPCRTCTDTATTVVEYRVPDPRSTCDETFPSHHLLTCSRPRCVDLAEAEATYVGAPDRHIDVRLIDRREANAILGAVT